MSTHNSATRKSASRVAGRAIAAKARRAAGKLRQDRIHGAGLTSRTRGHVSARGRRAQARRDTR